MVCGAHMQISDTTHRMGTSDALQQSTPHGHCTMCRAQVSYGHSRRYGIKTVSLLVAGGTWDI